MTLQPHADVAKFSNILFNAARDAGVERPIFEIRIIKGGRDRVISGYFDSAESAAKAAEQRSGTAEAIYITPNPAMVDCFGRAANKLKPNATATTTDAQIVKRSWFLIDVDAVRPKGVSSTEPQHAAALAKVSLIRDFLGELGFPAPVVGDSGNGGHLMYRIDLPNDAESTSLVKRSLAALAHRFDDPEGTPNGVKVDTSVHNAARIWKVYGTMACKGDNLPEQPHRRSSLMDTPELLEVATRDALALLATMDPAAAKESKTSTQHGDFDVMTWLREHAGDIEIGEERDLDGGGWIRELSPCPWGDHEKDRAAWVGQRSSGAIIAGCRHDRCQGKGWSDLRAALDPDRKLTQAGNRPPPHTDDDAPPQYGRLSLVPPPWTASVERAEPVAATPAPPVKSLTADVADFIGDDEPDDTEEQSPKDWIVPMFIPRAGLTILGGPPKIGKTFVLLDLALAISSGQTFCGHWPTFPGRVLALLEEDTTRRIRMRLWRMARGRGLDPRSLTGQLRLAAMTGFRLDNKDMLQRLEQEIETYKPDVVFIDALSRVHSADENDRTAMRAVTVPLQALCQKYGVAIVLVHHFKKVGLGDEHKRSGELLRGSGDLFALARSVIGVQRIENRRGFQIDAAGNDGEVAPALVELDNGENEYGKLTIVLKHLGPAEDAQTSEDADQVLAAIRAAMPAGLGQRELRNAVPKMSSSRVDAAVAFLREHNRIFKAFFRAPWRCREGG